MRDSRNPSFPVIDLFAGPGGLGEGFSSFRVDGEKQPFKIRLSIEKESGAHQTLQLRSFYRQFHPEDVPDKYYDVLRGTATTESLLAAYPAQATAAQGEAWQATLGVTSRAIVNERIQQALNGSEMWVLIGGPPCQAYSVAGRARNSGIKGYKPEEDERQYLYVEYLQVIADHSPAVFVMENVKGLISAKLNHDGLFQRIVGDLREPHEALRREHRTVGSVNRKHTYRVLPLAPRKEGKEVELDDYVVASEKHGIPQSRHRVILVGIRDDLSNRTLPPLTEMDEIPVGHVLNGLPRVRSGLSTKDSAEEWLRNLNDVLGKRWLMSAGRNGGAETQALISKTVRNLTAPKRDRGAAFIHGEFVPKHEAEWYLDRRLNGVCHHETRGHLASDLHRYLFVAAFGKVTGRSPTLKDFPKDLLPNHQNVEMAVKEGGIFNDRFRVQISDRPASTITSHIAKDGHYYIHPDPTQCRSITLREAARLQTFPDNYFFCGHRTRGYAQVGNAVPPLLARGIAESVWQLLAKTGVAE